MTSRARAALGAALPGTDFNAGLHSVFQQLATPHLPALALQPHRGPHADLTARTVSMLAEMGADYQPYGWRLTNTGHQTMLHQRRAAGQWRADLNELTDYLGENQIEVTHLALHVLGPVSLAARLWLSGGERALRDYGARRDIRDSLIEGIRDAVAHITQSTGAAVVLMVEEPAAVDVLTGGVPTASGYYTVRSVERVELREHWRTFSEQLSSTSALSTAGPAKDPLPEAVVFAPGLNHGSISEQQTVLSTMLSALPDDIQEAEEPRDGDAASSPNNANFGHGIRLPLTPVEGAHARPDVWERIAELAEAGRTLYLERPLQQAVISSTAGSTDQVNNGPDSTGPSNTRPATIDPVRSAQRLQHDWNTLGLDAQYLGRTVISVPSLNTLHPTVVPRILDNTRIFAERLTDPL